MPVQYPEGRRPEGSQSLQTVRLGVLTPGRFVLAAPRPCNSIAGSVSRRPQARGISRWIPLRGFCSGAVFFPVGLGWGIPAGQGADYHSSGKQSTVVREGVVNIRAVWLLAVLVAMAAPARAQAPSVVGTWEASLKDAKRSDAPRTVIVRPDSSASYGTETVRWRIIGAKTLMLALGGEWVSYDFKISGTRLTLSGGDLEKPITLTKQGPPTARPDSIPVPEDPDKST